MQLGMIGLGRMGASMVRRLLQDGHACVVHDVQPSAVAGLVKDGAAGAASLKEMVSQLGQPRTIWLMVPAVVVDRALGDLVPLLDAGDIVVDGGNSYYRDDMRRGTQLQTRGLHYLDVGTSGGVAGLERGYCLMIGGEGAVVEHVRPRVPSSSHFRLVMTPRLGLSPTSAAIREGASRRHASGWGASVARLPVSFQCSPGTVWRLLFVRSGDA